MNHETDKHGGSVDFFASGIKFFGKTNVVRRRTVVAIGYEF